jgi:hypothetical protein
MLVTGFKQNRKGIAPIFIFLIIFAVFIAIYLFLLLPIPSFQKIRAIVNLFIMIGVWFVFQGLIIYGYFQVGKLSKRGFNLYKNAMFKITTKTKRLFGAGV